MWSVYGWGDTRGWFKSRVVGFGVPLSVQKPCPCLHQATDDRSRRLRPLWCRNIQIRINLQHQSIRMLEILIRPNAYRGRPQMNRSHRQVENRLSLEILLKIMPLHVPETCNFGNEPYFMPSTVSPSVAFPPSWPEHEERNVSKSIVSIEATSLRRISKSLRWRTQPGHSDKWTF